MSKSVDPHLHLWNIDSPLCSFWIFVFIPVVFCKTWVKWVVPVEYLFVFHFRWHIVSQWNYSWENIGSQASYSFGILILISFLCCGILVLKQVVAVKFCFRWYSNFQYPLHFLSLHPTTLRINNILLIIFLVSRSSSYGILSGNLCILRFSHSAPFPTSSFLLFLFLYKCSSSDLWNLAGVIGLIVFIFVSNESLS